MSIKSLQGRRVVFQSITMALSCVISEIDIMVENRDIFDTPGPLHSTPPLGVPVGI